DPDLQRVAVEPQEVVQVGQQPAQQGVVVQVDRPVVAGPAGRGPEQDRGRVGGAQVGPLGGGERAGGQQPPLAAGHQQAGGVEVVADRGGRQRQGDEDRRRVLDRGQQPGGVGRAGRGQQAGRGGGRDGEDHAG